MFKNKEKNIARLQNVSAASEFLETSGALKSAAPPPLQFHKEELPVSGNGFGQEKSTISGFAGMQTSTESKFPMQLQSNPQTIQRNNGEGDSDFENSPISRPVTITIRLGAPAHREEVVTISNYSDLAKAYDELSTMMFFSKSDLIPDYNDNNYYKAYKNHNDTVDSYLHYYTRYENQSETPLNVEIDFFRSTLRDARQIGQNAYLAYSRRLHAIRAEISNARARVENSRTEALKAIRLMFLSGEKVDGSEQSDNSFLWAMVDHLATFSGALATAANLPLERLHTILPGAVSLANIVVNWSNTSPAMKGSGFEGLAALNNIVSVVGGLNGVFINPGYIVTSYIGPILSTITKMLGKLQIQLIERNDEATAILGNPLYIGAEPGGKQMWNYMVRAMQAGSKQEVTIPSGDVLKYFDKFKSRFDEFNKAKYQGDLKNYRSNSSAHSFPSKPEALPSERNYLLFSKLDAENFPGWLFSNRQLVWTCLYGSRDSSEAKPI